jgi:hypothetical protein
LFGPTPIETASPKRSSCHCRRLLERRHLQIETKERLVHTEGLHLRREREIEVEQLERERDVSGGMALDELGRGAAAARLGQAHPGPHTRGPRIIRRRGHHAAPSRVAADDNGPPPQVGMVELLDRGKIGVHVRKQDPHFNAWRPPSRCGHPSIF